MIPAKDSKGWPIVPGARVKATRGYKIPRLLKVQHTPACDEKLAAAAKAFGDAIGRIGCTCPQLMEEYEPTDEGIVVSVKEDAKHGTVVELRDLDNHGLCTKLPNALTVMRGNTKKSATYRELTDKSFRDARKARKEDK